MIFLGLIGNDMCGESERLRQFHWPESLSDLSHLDKGTYWPSRVTVQYSQLSQMCYFGKYANVIQSFTARNQPQMIVPHYSSAFYNVSLNVQLCLYKNRYYWGLTVQNKTATVAQMCVTANEIITRVSDWKWNEWKLKVSMVIQCESLHFAQLNKQSRGRVEPRLRGWRKWTLVGGKVSGTREDIDWVGLTKLPTLLAHELSLA